MNKDALRRTLEERWGLLEAEPVTGERRLRVSELPVDAARGPLAVAVDHDCHRHLLVPTHAHGRVRPGLDGPVLRLRMRPLEDAETYRHYADLSCMRRDLDDLFTELCGDVLVAVQDRPANPIRALHQVLDRWKALFRTHRAPLDAEQAAGLFGELTVLSRLIERDTGAHRLWTGALGHRHDFSAGRSAVEVKASLLREGRRPRIHGLGQLEVPDRGSLHLAWFRLRRTGPKGSGPTLVDLVESIRCRCDDEAAFLDLLASAGYHPADAPFHADVRYAIDEERWYRVDGDFPGLTGRALAAAGVPVSVLDVEYTVDLSGEVPPALSDEDVAEAMDAMIRESA